MKIVKEARKKKEEVEKGFTFKLTRTSDPNFEENLYVGSLEDLMRIVKREGSVTIYDDGELMLYDSEQ